MAKHIIIYSHGFGVGKDDRGLFTAIAAGLPGALHVMFDYNHIASDGVITVTPLSQQVEILRQKVNEIHTAHPTAIIDMVCHSQGCIVASLAEIDGIRKTIFLTPPVAKNNMMRLLWRRLRLNKHGLKFSRRDGTTTIITPSFLKSRAGIKPLKVYKKLAAKTKLTIIQANQDHILKDADLSDLLPVANIIQLDGDHNFKGAARQLLVEQIKAKLA